MSRLRDSRGQTEDTRLSKLRELLAGTTEVEPYEGGETLYLYCGKACRPVAHTVIKSGDAEPWACCSTMGCLSAPPLPVRYRVPAVAFDVAAAKYVRALLAESREEASR